MKPNSSVLIVDEDYEKLHHTAIELEAKDFHLIVTDNIYQLVDFLSGRELPYLVFLSDTIQNRDFLVNTLKKSYTKHKIIPIHQKDYMSAGLSIKRPYSAEDFLRIIYTELDITEDTNHE